MTSAAQPLYELQAIDARLDTERGAVQRITEALRGDPEIDAGRARVRELDAQLTRARSELRSREDEAEDLTVAIKKFNDRLYGGLIHDAREMKSIESEIEHARRMRSSVEDDAIGAMERVEALEAELARAQESAAQHESAREQELAHLPQEKDRRERAIQELEAERQTLTNTIEPSRLDLYRRLSSRPGHPVSRVQGGVCQWCRVQLPAADIQHARGDAIVTCTNCSRILYVD